MRALFVREKLGYTLYLGEEAEKRKSAGRMLSCEHYTFCFSSFESAKKMIETELAWLRRGETERCKKLASEEKLELEIGEGIGRGFTDDELTELGKMSLDGLVIAGNFS